MSRAQAVLCPCSKLESRTGERDEHPLAQTADLVQRLQQLARKQLLLAQAQALEQEVVAAQGIVLHSQLKARRRVLRRQGCVPGCPVIRLGCLQSGAAAQATVPPASMSRHYVAELVVCSPAT